MLLYSSYDYDSIGHSSGSSGWEILFFIIMIVGGILEIILFFKIWGMTNNVAKIRDKITPPLNSFFYESIVGNKQACVECLNKKLYQSLLESFYNVKDGGYDESLIPDKFVKLRNETIKEYSKIYEKLNLEIPKGFTTITYSDLYTNRKWLV